PDGDLWTAGRWAAGKIRWVAANDQWFETPRPDGSGNAFSQAFGDPYDGACSGNPPVFCPPQEGDPVALSAVAVAADGRVWFASGPNYSGDTAYGVASWAGHGFTYYDPVRDLGLPDANVRDLLALPDGRLVLASASGGLVFWNPATGEHTSLR